MYIVSNHVSMFRLDYRDILTSNTSPDIATEETTLSSRETSTFIIEALFISKDNIKIESGTYVKSQ